MGWRGCVVGAVEACSDVSVVHALHSSDVVADWRNGIDRIHLAGRTGIDDFSDLAGTCRQRGADVVISFGANAIIVLKDADLSDLDGRDFIF